MHDKTTNQNFKGKSGGQVKGVERKGMIQQPADLEPDLTKEGKIKERTNKDLWI